jgi:hypothetical protein
MNLAILGAAISVLILGFRLFAKPDAAGKSPSPARITGLAVFMAMFAALVGLISIFAGHLATGIASVSLGAAFGISLFGSSRRVQLTHKSLYFWLVAYLFGICLALLLP